MASVGADEGNSVLDGTGSDSDTQSPSTSSSSSGGKLEDGNDDELQTLQFTEPFHDIIPDDSGLPQTQLLNLGDETQVLDYQDWGEGMTQLVNGCDYEMLADSDSQGTNGTQVLTDVDDDGSEIGIGDDVVELEKMQLNPSKDQTEKDHVVDSDASTDDGHGLALRDSGPVIGSMTCEGTQTFPNSNPSNGQFGLEVDHNNDIWGHNGSLKKRGNTTKCTVGNPIVRELFKDDSLAGNKESPCNIDGTIGGTESPQLVADDHQFVGLSYVESQEPGEESQANALDVVDRFLSVNNVELSQDVDHGTTVKGKSPPVLNAKGPQSLAKRPNLSPVGAVGIYDWIDSREDEGGGCFFTKRKESFFEKGGHGRRSLTQPQNSRRRKGHLIEEAGQKEKGFNLHQKIIGLTHSDSRLMLRNSKAVHLDETKTKKNLSGELDKQLNVESPEKNSKVPGINLETPGAYEVGFDTQMAAEAMEALFYGDPSNQDVTDAHQVTEMVPSLKHVSPKKRAHPPGSGGSMRQSKQGKMLGTKLSKETLTSSRKCNKNRKVKVPPDSETEPKLKRRKFKSAQHLQSGNAVNGNENSVRRSARLVRERKTVDPGDSAHVEDAGKYGSSAATNGHLPLGKRQCQEDSRTFTAIAHRTRQCIAVNSLKKTRDSSDDSEEGKDGILEVAVLENKRKRRSSHVGASNVLVHAETHSKLDSNQIGVASKGKVSQEEQQGFGTPKEKLAAKAGCMRIGALSYPRGRRTHRNMSRYLNKVDNLNGPSPVSDGVEINKQSVAVQQRENDNVKSSCIKLDVKRKTRSGAYPCLFLSSAEKKAEEKLSRKDLCSGLGDANDNLDSMGVNGNSIPRSQIGAKASMQSGEKDESTEREEVNAKLEASPSEKATPSYSACTTPSNGTPINTASPVCLGSEYPKQSCRKSLSRSCLKRELIRLGATEAVSTPALKDLRRRRDITTVRVLFSHHLDEDIIKQQKKILARLGVPLASSSSDATHFVADKFVRTRNMLEAIALGKPVVTHLWLESCRQARSFIDEKNYILRDLKKEREIGFSMPVTLARAGQCPLLQGKQVFITPNIKPGKELIASLVKAVCGQAVERIGRSAVKDDKVPDNLLVLSSEEDYAICVPLLEKGASIYSSELLLNGIVIQKLEYERHLIFVDHVKRTRSTIWLRKEGNQFLPVTKCK
ncbi:uncharacterized protein LOC122091343 isoform X2 [Macadamia integrifolia]|uniref:uncharacterized protein LOC122091343 isoform X2 n=1 Tax=Macadamia integrifolia TaxID=60698 RepID=UPI001C4FD79F|nr:uncharacterized protein LOC122091343 isoform X2 [Macadamia integrifolia]